MQATRMFLLNVRVACVVCLFTLGRSLVFGRFFDLVDFCPLSDCPLFVL